MIVDPTDPTKAIDPETGNMASEIYLVSKIANPEAPTIAELSTRKFLGHARFTFLE